MKARTWLVSTFTLVLLGGGVLLGWLSLRPGKFDFEKLGGTILVYEIELNPAGNDPRLAEWVAESLRRRFDPEQRGEAAAAPVGGDRVEIRVPRISDDHPAKIQRIKDLATQTGFLEFLMLANDVDDRQAINLATDMLNVGDDPKLEREIADCKHRGLPPPALRPPWAPEVFDITLSRGQKSTVTYRWVELGRSELKFLSLDDAAEFEEGSPWQQAKAGRNRAMQLRSRWQNDNLLQGALFYSRDSDDRMLPNEKRRRSHVAYFVLAREPEFETPEAKTRVPAMDGSHFAALGVTTGDWPAIHFTFNKSGGELFAALTRKNISTPGDDERPGVRRHLAVLFDGKVLTAPTINSEIRGPGQITGNLTEQEMRNIADILRGGALPAQLKPIPVSEAEVGPIR